MISNLQNKKYIKQYANQKLLNIIANESNPN